MLPQRRRLVVRCVDRCVLRLVSQGSLCLPQSNTAGLGPAWLDKRTCMPSCVLSSHTRLPPSGSRNVTVTLPTSGPYVSFRFSFRTAQAPTARSGRRTARTTWHPTLRTFPRHWASSSESIPTVGFAAPRGGYVAPPPSAWICTMDHHRQLASRSRPHPRLHPRDELTQAVRIELVSFHGACAGTIPTDNPFYNSTTGNNRAIYATGFRNPFTITWQTEGNRCGGRESQRYSATTAISAVMHQHDWR